MKRDRRLGADFATEETQLPSSVGSGNQEGPAARVLREQVHNALFGNLASSPRLGRYVYLRQLGEGGMGIVCAAYDPKLDRKVAIKLILPNATESLDIRARMRREAQAMARISHPNVVQVYEITEIDDELCVVMEYLEGETLGEWASHNRSWQEVVSSYVQFAAGLATAHAEGIVHRDVKPDNAFIDRDGRVRVLDFGIAITDGRPDANDMQLEKLGTIDMHAPLKTRTGALLGTPAYMSLEQVEGKEVGTQADQFSLCASLYEALYGYRPFRGETWPELLKSLCDNAIEPPPARTNVPAWLHQVVIRGLARDPKDRWPSLDALSQALRNDPSVRRRQRLLMGGGVAIAATAVFTGWMAYLGSAETRAADVRAAESEAQTRAVEAQSRVALRESYLGSLNNSGYTELQRLDNPLRALVLLNEVYRDRPDDLHLRELLAVAARPVDAFEWTADGHTSSITSMAVSPDGSRVASAGSRELHVWDATTGNAVAKIDAIANPIGDLAFSFDGSRLVGVSDHGDVWSWEPESGEQLTHIPGSANSDSTFFRISPDRTRVARNVAATNGIEIVDVVGGSVVSKLPASSAFSMAWSADQTQLAIKTFKSYEVWDVPASTLISSHTFEGGMFGSNAGNGRNARMFDDGIARFVHVRDGRGYVRDTTGSELALEGSVETSEEDSDTAFQFLFDPGGSWVAVAARDGHLGLWELPTGKLRFRVNHGRSAFREITLSADGERIAAASIDGVVRIIEVKTGAQLARFDGHDAGVSAVSFNPAGDALFSGSNHGSVYGWNAAAQGLARHFDGALLGTRADAGAFVTRDASGAARLTQVDGEITPLVARSPGRPLAASFSPDSTQFALMTKREDDVVVEIRSATGEIHGEVSLGLSHVSPGVSWSEDGKLLLLPATNGSGEVVVVDVEKRGISARVKANKFALRPRVPGTGERLVTEGMNFAPTQFVLHIWDTTSWEELITRPGTYNTSAYGINHAQTVIARTGIDNVPEILDLKTGRLLHTMHDGSEPLPPTVYGELYRFSYDDSLVASAHNDGSIRLWNGSDGTLHTVLRGHGSSVTGFSLDRAGPRLASSGADGTAIVWDTETGNRISTLDPAPVALSQIGFTPDGEHVMATGADHSTRVWHIATGRLITRVAGTSTTEVFQDARTNGHLLTWDKTHDVGYLWNMPKETRSADLLDATIAARVPWVLDRGELRPR